MRKPDEEYWRSRVLDETRAALRASDPHVAAIHVELANGYAKSLAGAGREQPMRGK